MIWFSTRQGSYHVGKRHEAFLAGRSAVFYKGLGGGIEQEVCLLSLQSDIYVKAFHVDQNTFI